MDVIFPGWAQKYQLTARDSGDGDRNDIQDRNQSSTGEQNPADSQGPERTKSERVDRHQPRRLATFGVTAWDTLRGASSYSTLG